MGFSSLLSSDATDAIVGSEGPRFSLLDGSNHASLSASSQQVEEGGSSAIVQHMLNDVALSSMKEKHLMEVCPLYKCAATNTEQSMVPRNVQTMVPLKLYAYFALSLAQLRSSESLPNSVSQPS